MPKKYILSPKGNIKVISEDNSVQDISATDVTKTYTKERSKGPFSYKEGDFFKVANVNLPVGIVSAIRDEEINDVEILTKHNAPDFEKFRPDEPDIFPKKTIESSYNSSFGASTNQEDHLKNYKNFNDFLGKKEIFATEIEMKSGLDFNSGGLRDLTKFSLAYELIVESIVYIATIEAILATDLLFDSNNSINVENNFHMELGNYGPINYTSLTRYFNEVLRYPINKDSKPGAGSILDRLGAFFIGMSLFVNSDPLFLDKTLEGTNDLLLNDNAGFESINNIAFYFVKSLLTLNNIGSNRLLMLVRRFNQKAYWHEEILYKAKDDTKENPFEKYLAELGYYYVTFVIERINIGLQVKKYHRKKKNDKNRLFNRSSRIKDGLANQGFQQLNYDGTNLEININTESQYFDHKSSLSNSVLPQAFIMPKSLRLSQSVESKSYEIPDLVSSYFLETSKKQERLSKDVVKKIEAFYEKEMMPFYFQDLRTNEVIGFHAFIESVTDNFNANYNQTKGYGRVDDIRHYIDTTRNVNLTFALAAMSKEDHDLMWYQINKIVSMVYPQWSKGYESSNLDDENSNPDKLEYPFTQVPTASPLIRIRLGDVLKSNYTRHSIRKIHGSGNNASIDKPSSPGSNFLFYLIPGEYKVEDGNIITITSFKKIDLKEKIKVKDTYAKVEADINGIQKTLIVDAKSIFKYKSESFMGPPMPQYIQYQKSIENYVKPFEDKKINNPVTAAYDSTFGKGLAGFITYLDVNYQDQVWETEVEGSKAPKLVKLTINFAPLHDIPPGLDADGAMRAPVYNAGKIINTLYGEPYEE